MRDMSRIGPLPPTRLLLLLGCLVLAGPVRAQSLAEVARQEEARRKAITTPGKVYTNQDLRPAPPPAVPPPSATPAPDTSAVPAQKPPDGAEPAAPPAEGKRDETYWRQRLQTERDALDRARMFADALQSRINALTTDFVNRDDPAQRAVIASDRDAALAELERVKKEIEQRTKSIADIQEEGRKAGAPAGWLR